MAERVRLADIRDKDDAHPHGVVGWRREYHAMRQALDAVIAETSEWLDRGEGSPGYWSARAIRRAIESVIDLGGANASQPAVDHHSGDEVKVSDQSKEVQR